MSHRFDRIRYKARQLRHCDIDVLLDQQVHRNVTQQERLDAETIFSTWRAANKVAVNAADGFLDTLWGLLLLINGVAPCIQLDEIHVQYFTLKTFAINAATSPPEAVMTQIHADRWTWMTRTALNVAGLPVNLDEMYEHVLTHAGIITPTVLHPMMFLACGDLIIESVRDAMHVGSVNFAAVRASRGAYGLIFKPSLVVKLSQMVGNIFGQISRRTDVPFCDLQLVLEPIRFDDQADLEAFTLPQEMNESFVKSTLLVRTDVNISEGYRAYVLRRMQDRMIMFQRAIRAADHGIEDMRAQFTNATQSTLRARLDRKDEASFNKRDIFDLTMGGLHRARLLAEFTGFLVFDASELNALKFLAPTQRPAVYADQINAKELVGFIRTVQDRFAMDSGAKLQHSKLVTYYGLLASELVNAEANFYPMRWTTALQQLFQEEIWENRDTLPVRVPYVTAGMSGTREPFHPIEYSIYFRANPGFKTRPMSVPRTGPATMSMNEGVAALPTQYIPLIVISVPLTKSEQAHNFAVIETYRYVSRREIAFTIAQRIRGQRRPREPTRLSSDEEFMDTLRGFIEHLPFSAAAMAQRSDIVHLRNSIAPFGFDAVFGTDLTVIISALVSQATIIAGFVPMQYEDSNAFKAVLMAIGGGGEGAPLDGTRMVGETCVYGHVQNILLAEVYKPTMTGLAAISEISPDALLVAYESVDEWERACTNFREGMRGAMANLEDPPEIHVTYETRFEVRRAKAVLPDNALAIDDAYFYAMAWLTNIPMTVENFAPFHVPDMWMVNAHNNGIIPRTRGIFTYAYFATQPRLLPAADAHARRVLVRDHGNRLNLQRGSPAVGTSPFTTCAPLHPGRVRDLPTGFYSELLAEEKVTPREMCLTNAAESSDPYVLARENLWRQHFWHAPIRSTPSGLDFFRAHGMFVPHGSPLPQLSAEVLLTGAWMADHEITEYVGYVFVTYRDNNYRMGIPKPGSAACAIIAYMQESATLPGVLHSHTPCFALSFPKSSPMDLLPFIAQKYSALVLPNRHAVFRERLPHVVTVGNGIAFHEQMMQVAIPGAPTTTSAPIFIIHHRLPGAPPALPTALELENVYNVPRAYAEQFIGRLEEAHRAAQTLEHMDVNVAPDFRLCNAVAADRLVQMLEMLGFTHAQLEYIELNPNVCAIPGQIMLIQFPFLILMNPNVRQLIAAMVNLIMPVPQTLIEFADPDDVSATSVYPLRLESCSHLFVADAIHSGHWQRHDEAVFVQQRQEQETAYNTIRGRHIIAPTMDRYRMGTKGGGGGGGVHMAAALTNLRPRAATQHYLTHAVPSGQTTRLDVAGWICGIVRESKHVDMASVTASPCPRQIGANVAPCGCSLLTLKSTFSCKAVIRRLLGMIALQNVSSIAYHEILAALVHEKFQNVELEQISKALVPRSEESDVMLSPEALVARNAEYPPWSVEFGAELSAIQVFKYADGMAIAIYARESSPVRFAQFQQDILRRYMPTYDDDFLRKDYLISESLGFIMSLDYTAVPDQDIEKQLHKFCDTGFELQNDVRDSLRVIAMREVLPLLRERVTHFQQALAAAGADRALRATIKQSLNSWTDALSTISRFACASNLRKAVHAYLMNPAPMDDINCLFRCKNVVLWGDRAKRKVHVLKGRPYYRMRFSCRINYIARYAENDKNMIAAKKLLSQLFELPHEEGENKYRMIKHVLGAVLARVVDGDPSEKWKFFFIGPGDNGKTVFSMLLAAIFGDYFATSPNSFFMHSQDDPGKAMPHLHKIVGKRMVVTAEPKESQIYDGCKLKLFIGPDDVDYRGLFQASGTFRIIMRFLTMTNHWPLIDGGGWQAIMRLHFIEMITRFGPGYPALERDQYLMRHYPPDEGIQSLIPSIAEPILSLIIENYCGGEKEEIPETRRMMEQYLHSSEPVTMFMDEWTTPVERTVLQEHAVPPHVHVNTLYRRYVDFMEKSLKMKRQPQSLPEFVKSLKASGRDISLDMVEFITLNQTASSATSTENNEAYIEMCLARAAQTN